MEVTMDSVTGLYTVTLDGVLYNNCTTDADCPGRAGCFVNQTWTAFPNMCACSFAIGHTGGSCETTTPYGMFFFVMHIFACSISSAFLLLSLYNLFLLIKCKRFHRDALSTSLVFALLASFFTMLENGSSTRFSFQFIAPDLVTGSKTDTNFVIFGVVSLIFSFFFSTLAMMNVSVVWIEIADNADKMLRSRSHNISRYSKFLAAYYLVFMCLIAVTIILGELLIAAAISLPGVIFVIVTYVVGYFKMRKTLSMFLSSNAVGPGSTTGMTSVDVIRRMRESLRAIEIAALSVSFCALNFVVFIGIWVFMGGFDDRPGKDFSIAALSLGWVAVSASNAAVMWYLHGTIQRKIKAMDVSLANKNVVAVMGYTANETPNNRRTVANDKRQPLSQYDVRNPAALMNSSSAKIDESGRH